MWDFRSTLERKWMKHQRRDKIDYETEMKHSGVNTGKTHTHEIKDYIGETTKHKHCNVRNASYWGTEVNI